MHWQEASALADMASVEEILAVAVDIDSVITRRPRSTSSRSAASGYVTHPCGSFVACTCPLIWLY